MTIDSLIGRVTVTNVGTWARQSMHQLLQSGQASVASSSRLMTPRFSEYGQSIGSREGWSISAFWQSSGNVRLSYHLGMSAMATVGIGKSD
jgi:hypothetical protein